MRFLLDQGVGRGAAELLRGAGHDAVHVAELGLSAAPDEVLLSAATREQRVIVTLDADFHALVAVRRAREPSIIRVRIEGLRSSPLAALIQQVASRCATEIQAGALVTVDENSIRVHPLPVG